MTNELPEQYIVRYYSVADGKQSQNMEATYRAKDKDSHADVETMHNKLHPGTIIIRVTYV